MPADGEDDPTARAPPRPTPPKPKRDFIVIEGQAADVNGKSKPPPSEASPRIPERRAPAGGIGAGAIGGVIGAVLTLAGLWALDARPAPSELAQRIDVLEREANDAKASLSRLAALEATEATAATERKSLSDKLAALPPAAPPEAVAELSKQVSALQAAASADAAVQKSLSDDVAQLKAGNSAPSPEAVAELSKQVSALQAAASADAAVQKSLSDDVAQLKAGATAPPPSEEVAELAKQVSALQAAASAGAAVQKSLSDDVAQLKGEASAAAPDAELEKRVAALEARTPSPAPAAAAATPGPDPRVAELAAGQAALSDKVAKVGAGADALSARLGKLEAAVFAGKAETRVAPSEATASPPKPQDATIRAIAALALRARLGAGEPYAAELAALLSAGVEPSALDPLRPFADTGAPTLAALTRAFQGTAPEIKADARASAGDGAVDRLLGEVQGLVKVRKVGESPAKDSGASPRARAALADGDLEGAVAEMNTWPEAARAPAADWLKRAQGRIAATKAADALVQAAIADLGAANK